MIPPWVSSRAECLKALASHPLPILLHYSADLPLSSDCLATGNRASYPTRIMLHVNDPGRGTEEYRQGMITDGEQAIHGRSHSCKYLTTVSSKKCRFFRLGNWKKPGQGVRKQRNSIYHIQKVKSSIM